MRLMSKGEYLIVPKGIEFTGLGKLGLKEYSVILTAPFYGINQKILTIKGYFQNFS